jgi:hypothetical protein
MAGFEEVPIACVETLEHQCVIEPDSIFEQTGQRKVWFAHWVMLLAWRCCCWRSALIITRRGKQLLQALPDVDMRRQEAKTGRQN